MLTAHRRCGLSAELGPAPRGPLDKTEVRLGRVARRARPSRIDDYAGNRADGRRGDLAESRANGPDRAGDPRRATRPRPEPTRGGPEVRGSTSRREQDRAGAPSQAVGRRPGATAAVLGLELSLKAYPAGHPLRDAAHVALLDRLRARLSPRLTWRSEVPLANASDRRAWDACIWASGLVIGVEVETRIRDLQAIERRLALKKRDGAVASVLLLLADTRWNRSMVRLHDDPTLRGVSCSWPGRARGPGCRSGS